MKLTKRQLRKIIKEELTEADIEASFPEKAITGAAVAASIFALPTTVGFGTLVGAIFVALGGGEALAAKLFKDTLRGESAIKLNGERIGEGKDDAKNLLLAFAAARASQLKAADAQEQGVKMLAGNTDEDITDKVMKQLFYTAIKGKQQGRIKFHRDALDEAEATILNSDDPELAEVKKVIEDVHSEVIAWLKKENMLASKIETFTNRVTKELPKLLNRREEIEEAKIRQGFRHKHGHKIGGITGLAIGTLLGTPGMALGAIAGVGGTQQGNKLYDKYLLSKVATESDLVHIGKLKKEESLLGEEPWDINLWLDEAIGSLSSSQKESIIYEEGELLEAGQKEEEEELASQIIDYLSKEGMLDTASEQSLPAEEVPQIGTDMGIEDERMIAESFRRMRRLAGLK